MSASLPMYGLILFCILADAMRELCFKLGADHETVFNALKHPIVWLGVAFWLVEIIAWTMVLEHVPLSVAFPLMSLTYVFIVLSAVLFLKEKIKPLHMAGVFMITLGVAILGVNG